MCGLVASNRRHPYLIQELESVLTEHQAGYFSAWRIRKRYSASYLRDGGLIFAQAVLKEAKERQIEFPDGSERCDGGCIRGFQFI